MNEFCAAMGICNLRHIDDEIKKRKNVFEKYSELLGGVDGLIIPHIQSDVLPNYSYYPVLFNEDKFKKTRDEVYNELISNDIYARKYFYPLTSDFVCYKDLFDSSLTPVAKWISDRILTLPLYADLEMYEIERIAKIIL